LFNHAAHEGDWLSKSSDFFAGFGDTISFGLTRKLRDSLSFYDGTVDYDSGYYEGGENAAIAVETAQGGRGLAKLAGRRGLSAAIKGSKGKVPSLTTDVAKATNRVKNVSKADSPIWKSLDKGKGGTRSLGSGKSKTFHQWDHTHNDIEVYDYRGKHLGSMHPVTGDFYKPRVKGRTLKF
jgi:hypothetical protein